MTLIELAERCERATGPDSELDEAIMAALFERRTRFIGVHYTDGRRSMSKVWVDPVTRKWVSTHAYQFTASLDAAMTLVPEGWDIELCTGEGVNWVKAYPPNCLIDEMSKIPQHSGASPALAMCAASLRARATLTKDTPK